MQVEQYFKELEKSVGEAYAHANIARKKGIDPADSVEVPVATSLAERVLGLVSVLYPQINDKRIVERVHELEKQYGPLDPAVALSIAEEVAKEKFCKFKSHLEAIEAGIRVALGYLTLGYVSSPIEGFIQLKVKKTADGKDYLAPYYSGPIRSAGGSEAAFSLVVVDYLRELFGYAKYDPTEDEVKRGIHECYEYHERITNLQYLPSEQELDFMFKNLPVQLSGDPSEEREVFNYKDLPRIETNILRSGFCLVGAEGMAQKAPKCLKRVLKLRQQGFKLTDWDWLEEFVKLQKKIKEGKKSDASRGGATYIQDIVGGRPIFSHPSQSGGFRLRYGRCRTTGYSTLAVHPATMAITNGFIAVGTQLKIEKPTKGCTVASCDTIDGPIVVLDDGSVKFVNDYDEGVKLQPRIKEIIYLGDILVPFGDFLNRNHGLEKAGYVEEYWLTDLKKVGGETKKEISFREAVEISQKYDIPLNPKYIFFWKEISSEQLLGLIDWIAHGIVRNEVFALPYSKLHRERFAHGKRALELLGCEHEVALEDVLIKQPFAEALLFNLGISIHEPLDQGVDRISLEIKKETGKLPLEIVQKICALKISDKSGTWIGARMGRPEKAKLRKLIGSPHVLFPVGEEGGRMRSVQTAVENGIVRADFPNYFCATCKRESIYRKCETCGNYCQLEEQEKNENGYGNNAERSIEIKSYFDSARRLIGMRNDEVPSIIKGVKGTSNSEHVCEHLAKGLLRAKHGLHVNKDGTIRYDMTEMPITHFKPVEVGTSVEKLKTLGYEKDINGQELKTENQILELFPHDIILPACPVTPDERADDVFLNVGRFIDEELVKIYNTNPYFNAKKREDLVGSLFGCMSPHTSAVAVGRLVGFSKVQALLASPYIHAAMRRDCDGDEAAVMMLMDLLLNFSRKFIPSHRGGTQDAPLVLNMRIRANEVDDMIFDLDVTKEIPYELYSAAKEKKHPSEVKMEQVKNRLGGKNEFTGLNFTHDTSDLNKGALCSSYKTLPTMQEKVDGMMHLCKKIRAVDASDAARLIIERHFIRDTRGNLRKFSQQGFRCVTCNSKFRRPPLVGKCTTCGNKIIFTISEGSILKYMEPALALARNYNVSPYLLESLELTQSYIESIFGKDKETQEGLNKWF